MEQNRNCGNNGFEMYNIGDKCEYVQYAIEIERTLHNMQKELNTCIDPRKAAMLIMRVATEFYDADWCGILDVDAGSAVPSMTTDILNAMEVTIPSASALEEFESLVAPMYRAMQENDIQSSKLSELRDALLPKLMSGEIDVANIQL